ncbi:MAG TPA: aminoglycoside phosphotransferase family protein [Allosphingosinicella sp.]|nr:aminoglycoside phosphotransferase family protein [Allosphingosinicella sp.]
MNPSGVLPIDAELVSRLVEDQFPQWSHLPVTAIEPGGWDNRSFRLGDGMVARLPSSASYADQVAKEQHWLPILAPSLPVAIPKPLALGRPGAGYPWHWSVYAWLPGETAASGAAHDPAKLARALADFLRALHRIDPTGGPPPGQHNCYRGAPLARYDAEVRHALTQLGDLVNARRTLSIWESAAALRWQQPPVWLHGDIALDNLLLRDGSLSAVIDFGCCGVGDPACDLAIAWSGFDAPAREVFRQALPLDPATWERGRGWALWKALITLAGGSPERAEAARRTLAQVLAG